MYIQYNNRDVEVQRAYFTGTNTLVAGQPLCWQESPATASSTKGFPFDVEIPNSGNFQNFAGIVAPTSVGVTGPAYVDIIIPRPGDILQVLCFNNTVGDVATSDILDMKTDSITTATVTDHVAGTGGFGNMVAATAASSTSLPANHVNGLLKAVLARGPLARPLESIASATATTPGVNKRNLRWVQFL